MEAYNVWGSPYSHPANIYGNMGEYNMEQQMLWPSAYPQNHVMPPQQGQKHQQQQQSINPTMVPQSMPGSFPQAVGAANNSRWSDAQNTSAPGDGRINLEPLSLSVKTWKSEGQAHVVGYVDFKSNTMSWTVRSFSSSATCTFEVPLSDVANISTVKGEGDRCHLFITVCKGVTARLDNSERREGHQSGSDICDALVSVLNEDPSSTVTLAALFAAQHAKTVVHMIVQLQALMDSSRSNSGNRQGVNHPSGISKQPSSLGISSQPLKPQQVKAAGPNAPYPLYHSPYGYRGPGGGSQQQMYGMGGGMMMPQMMYPSNGDPSSCMMSPGGMGGMMGGGMGGAAMGGMGGMGGGMGGAIPAPSKGLPTPGGYMMQPNVPVMMNSMMHGVHNQMNPPQNSSDRRSAFLEQEANERPGGKGVKRKRQRLTPEQGSKLEDAFDKDSMPNHEVKLRLAQTTALSYDQVRIWFQNRRAKQKRGDTTEPAGDGKSEIPSSRVNSPDATSPEARENKNEEKLQPEPKAESKPNEAETEKIDLKRLKRDEDGKS